MVDFLIRWSLRNRLFVILLALIVAAGGAWLGSRMPIDVFPDLTAPTVTVITEGRSLAPEEMEALVTIPVEAAMNGASAVRRVRSSTALGISVVWVEFEWGTDLARARQTVTERLATLAGKLPEQAQAPKLAPVSSIMGEILFFSLTAEQFDGLALRTVAQTQIRRRLLSIEGVSQVTPIGGDVRQFQVVLALERLWQYRIDPVEIVQALEGSNENVAAGVGVDGAREWVIEGIGRARSVDDLASTVVCVRDGVPIRIQELGIVQIGSAPKRGSASTSHRYDDGRAIVEDAVVMAVQKQPGANTLELTRKLDQALIELERELPPGMHIHRDLFRQATFIETAVANTTLALIEGAAMVVLVVLLFLASLRASLVTLVVLPLSLLTALLCLYFLGDGINTMTLGGMAIAIGALVDDAIIDVENVVRRLRENRSLPASEQRSTLEVVYAASAEVRGSVVLATVIILLVFTPLYLLSGVEGRLLLPLGLAFSVSLAASLLVALTLTPALCTLALPSSATVRNAHEPRFIRALKRVYAPVLDWSLTRPGLLSAVALLLLGGAGWLMSRSGTGFLPEFNEGALVIGVVTEPGTSLEESHRMARRVDEALMRHPEIVAVGRRTGRAEEDEHVQGVEASEIDLTLDLSAAQRRGATTRTREEFLEALRKDLAAIPGIQATIGQPIGHRIDHMLSGTRASIAIKIFGADLAALKNCGREVERAIADIPGIVDLSVEQQSMVPALRLALDRERMALHGVRVEDANQALRLSTLGLTAGSILDGADAWEIVVRTGSTEALNMEALSAIPVRTLDGRMVPLAALANILEDRTPNFISRENLQRKLVVTCNTAGRDVGSVVADIRNTIAARVQVPDGLRIEYGGQFESSESTRSRLYALGIILLLTIGALLHWMFGSARDAALVMANLPLALIGGVVGIELSGGVLNVAVLIGFITVFGVAARNGIMVVSHIRHLQQEEGVRDLHSAVRRAALERLAPVLMTALAAGLALVPLALRGDEPGNEILSPMAIVILCGLLSSTLLNMLIVPTLYLRWGRPALPRVELKPLLAGLIALCSVAWSSCASREPRLDWQAGSQELERSTGSAQHARPDRAAAGDAQLEAALADGLGLQEAMQMALQRSPQLRAGFHALGVAQAEYAAAGVLQNPVLGLAWLFPESGGRSQLELGLVQPLADWWRIPSRQALADAQVQRATLDLSRTARELLLQVRSAWLELALARTQLPLQAQLSALARERELVAAERFELGAGSQSELSQARLLRISAEQQQQHALLEVRSAEHELAQLLCWDRSFAAVELPLESGVIPPQAPSSEWIARASSQRVDLRWLAAELQVAQADLERLKAERHPNVELGVGLERPAEDGSWIVGPVGSIEVPLFHRNEARIAAAEQELARRQVLFQAAQAAVMRELLQWTDQAEQARIQAQTAEQVLLPEALRLVDQLKAALPSGSATRMDLLEAQTQRLEAERFVWQAQAQAWRAYLHLQEVVGGPLVD